MSGQSFDAMLSGSGCRSSAAQHNSIGYLGAIPFGCTFCSGVRCAHLPQVPARHACRRTQIFP